MVGVETTTIEVTVTRLRPSLLRVRHNAGYQIVLCGRLLLEVAGDRRVQHPDLPEYTPGMFPENFVEWSDSESTSTKVMMLTRKSKERDIGPVRASSLLFNAMPVEMAKAWLKERAGQ